MEHQLTSQGKINILIYSHNNSSGCPKMLCDLNVIILWFSIIRLVMPIFKPKVINKLQTIIVKSVAENESQGVKLPSFSE